MGSSWPRSESTFVLYANVLGRGRMLNMGFRLEPPPYNGVKLRGGSVSARLRPQRAGVF
jgi:hypothetical protein